MRDIHTFTSVTIDNSILPKGHSKFVTVNLSEKREGVLFKTTFTVSMLQAKTLHSVLEKVLAEQRNKDG